MSEAVTAIVILAIATCVFLALVGVASLRQKDE